MLACGMAWGLVVVKVYFNSNQPNQSIEATGSFMSSYCVGNFSFDFSRNSLEAATAEITPKDPLSAKN